MFLCWEKDPSERPRMTDESEHLHKLFHGGAMDEYYYEDYAKPKKVGDHYLKYKYSRLIKVYFDRWQSNH